MGSDLLAKFPLIFPKSGFKEKNLRPIPALDELRTPPEENAGGLSFEELGNRDKAALGEFGKLKKKKSR